MKSLGKLKINSAKMLNNEELINLKGGVMVAETCGGVPKPAPIEGGSWTCSSGQWVFCYE